MLRGTFRRQGAVQRLKFPLPCSSRKTLASSCFRVQANPLDEACEEEGQVVCHQGRIKGQPGVAMDDLVYVCTKIARQMDAAGIDKVANLCVVQNPQFDSLVSVRPVVGVEHLGGFTAAHHVFSG